MSEVTDYLTSEIKPITDAFFNTNKGKYDFSEVEGCGFYTEALVDHLQSLGYSKAGHLKKTGSGKQFNGHAIDAILWREPDPDLLRAVDVIANAETHNASAGFSIDEPRYSDDMWLDIDGGNNSGGSDMVPYVPYDENGFQELKRTLAYDYARRPQGADFDVTVWAARVFHNAYMGPTGTPLGLDAGIARAREEWCSALGVPVIPVPVDWQIGQPV